MFCILCNLDPRIQNEVCNFIKRNCLSFVKYEYAATIMGTSISFMPTTGFDTQRMRNGQTGKIVTHTQCITAMMVYSNKSLEELRLEDYQLGRKGSKDGNGTCLYRFEPVRWPDLCYVKGEQVHVDCRLQSITAMKEYKHASFEELRLGDYREGRGPKFNPIAERCGSVFDRGFQPISQQQGEKVYCNLINNLNITLPSVHFLGAPSQQREVINAKRRLQHNFKTIKTTNTTSSLPFKFKSGVLNKSLDTVMSTVAQITNFDTNNDFVKNTANTNCNDDANEARKLSDKGNVQSGYEYDDTEMVICNETMVQERENNSTSDVDKADEVQNTVNKDSSVDNTMLERKIGVSHSSETILSNVRGTSSPNKVQSHEKTLNCSKNSYKTKNCSDTDTNETLLINSKTPTSHNSEDKFNNNNNDVKGTKFDVKFNHERKANDKNEYVKESYTTEFVGDCNATINIIDEPQCENNLQTSDAENSMVNQESITNNSNDKIEIQLNHEYINKMSDFTCLNEDGDNKNKETHEEAVKCKVKLTEDNAIDVGLEPQQQSLSLPINIDQNTIEDEDKIKETKNIFCFNSAPKPRMIVKPSKLQNIVSFKTPNSRSSPPKSIFNGYPFLNPNSRNRFNFDKDNDLDKKATLNAHLQLFANKTSKPDSHVNNNVTTSATARYIRKFTPFSFQESSTANSNDTSVKPAPSPFFRVDFAKKRTKPNSNIFNSVKESSTSSIFSTPQTSSIKPATFPPINNFKPFSFSSIRSNTSAFNIASIQSPSLTVKPATGLNSASSFNSNFGVDIINYGASTSKECTAMESSTSKSDIAPSFKDLSVSNKIDSEILSNSTVMQSERATSSSELTKRQSPVSMSVEEQNVVHESDTANANLSNESRTEAKTESASSVSAFKGASVPSSFKGKSLLKKSSLVKSSAPSNSPILDSNKPLLNSLSISPQKESSGEWGATECTDIATSSSATALKNPFYLGSNDDSPIKKKIVARSQNFKPQFKLTKSKLARPAFDFSEAATVSVNLSFDATNAKPVFGSSSSACDMLETRQLPNSSASHSASPGVQTASSILDESSNQSPPSVFQNFETLSDSLSLSLNSPSPLAQASNVSFGIPQSSSQTVQHQNTRPISPVLSFSFFDEFNVSINQTTLPPSNPTSIFNILNTEALHPLVLHREKHRYGDIIFNESVVTNASHHPRNLYFFSAIPVIINQIFTIKVTELFNSTNNDVVIGFTAVDPCGLNVLQLHDPIVLVDRLEYWVFETFKFQTNDEIKFQLKTNGDVEFYKNFRYTTSYFVDTTITLWLFIYTKNGVRSFSLKTNERTDSSVIEAMNMPVEQIDPNPPIDTAMRQNNEISNENILQNNSIWNFQIPPINVRKPVRRNVGTNGHQNINVLRRRPNFNVSSHAGQSTPLFLMLPKQNIAQDRGDNINEMNDQPMSDVLNKNSIPFSNVTDQNLGVNQSRTAKHSSKPPKRPERENECIICCDKGIDCVLYTCGHSCMCLECAVSILRQGDSKCPICRKIICDVIKIYKS